MARGKHRSKATTKDRNNYYRMIGVVYVMVLFGLVMVLSASSVRAFAETGDSYYYLKRQLISLGLGSAALLILARIPVRKLEKLAIPAMYAVVAMLVAVLIPGIGKSAGGASRWIPLGVFNLQPSEFAKFAVILYTAHVFAKHKGELRDIRDLIYPYGAVIAAIVLLVMKQPDMGTTLSICMAAFTMVFVGGINLRYIFGLGVMGALTMTYFTFSADYRLNRFMAFLDPNSDPQGAGWHLKQSLLAFGSGGMAGVGIGMSRQKYFYLPAAHTDFIFAIIGEELGLLGTLFTVVLFVVFTYVGIKISLESRHLFGRLLGAGITAMIATQALVNMGAVTGALPITGIPMPFISYGGSSLIVNLAAVGALLSVALDGEREASARGRRLRLVKEEEAREEAPRRARRKSASKKRSSSTAASSGTSKSSGSATGRSGTRSSGSSRRRKTSRPSSGGAEGDKSGTIQKKTTTRRATANASNNKRRRDGGSRVSGSRSRKSPAKGKK